MNCWSFISEWFSAGRPTAHSNHRFLFFSCRYAGEIKCPNCNCQIGWYDWTGTRFVSFSPSFSIAVYNFYPMGNHFNQILCILFAVHIYSGSSHKP
jgi:hypothetical protein